MTHSSCVLGYQVSPKGKGGMQFLAYKTIYRAETPGPSFFLKSWSMGSKVRQFSINQMLTRYVSVQSNMGCFGTDWLATKIGKISQGNSEITRFLDKCVSIRLHPQSTIYEKTHWKEKNAITVATWRTLSHSWFSDTQGRALYKEKLLYSFSRPAGLWLQDFHLQ